MTGGIPVVLRKVIGWPEEKCACCGRRTNHGLGAREGTAAWKLLNLRE